MAERENAAVSEETKEDENFKCLTKEEKLELRASRKRAAKKRKAAAALSLKQARVGYWFISPWIIGIIFLFMIPALTSLIYSFCTVGVKVGGVSLKFSGIENYIYIFTKSETFLPALTNSLKDMLYQVPIIAFFSMFIAQILNQKFAGRTYARIIFFLPVIIASGVVLDLIGPVMGTTVSLEAQENIFTFQEESLIINILNQSDLNPKIIEYLTSIVSDIFDITWKSGIQILLYLSALQGIPKSYYEVSSMEGATPWEEYWKITFPLLSPMTLVCVVYTIIDSFTYAQNEVMRLIDINNIASGNAGQGAAMSWTYFLMIAIILVLVIKFVFSKAVYTEE